MSVDKKTIAETLKLAKVIEVPENFTGKVTLEINYSQGGVQSVERSVKDIIR